MARYPAVLWSISTLRVCEPIRIYTDSLTSLKLIRRWFYCPHELKWDEQRRTLDEIGCQIALRTGRTELYKVRAHIGTPGNEMADTGAKKAAALPRDSDRLQEVPVDDEGRLINDHPHRSTIAQPDEKGGVLEVPVTNIKQQAKTPVSEWLMEEKKYKRTVLDMWREATLRCGLDKVASNSIWGASGRRDTRGLQQTLRARFLELVTPHMLAKRSNGVGAAPSEAVCTRCNTGLDSWAHMLMSCKHPDVREYYTKRHNEAGKKLVRAVRKGGLARARILSNFGKIDGDKEDNTVPSWMLRQEGRARILNRTEGDRGIKPDMVILEGWPSDAGDPPGPTKEWKGGQGRRRKVTVYIVELGFASDMKQDEKKLAKQLHYAPLIQELQRAGWRVNPEVLVITVGARATVPESNEQVMRQLQIRDSKERAQLQQDLVTTAMKHAGIIIAQIRRIQGRRSKKSTVTAREGVS